MTIQTNYLIVNNFLQVSDKLDQVGGHDQARVLDHIFIVLLMVERPVQFPLDEPSLVDLVAAAVNPDVVLVHAVLSSVVHQSLRLATFRTILGRNALVKVL